MTIRIIRKLRSLFGVKTRSAPNEILNATLNLPVANASLVTQGNLPSQDNLRIVFLIPTMKRNSGGLTSILRLGTFLSQFGNEVFYLTSDDSTSTQLNHEAEFNVSGYQGTFLEKGDANHNFDVGIATSWHSCYRLADLNHRVVYKAYFVQDYEPYFYSWGYQSILAKKTYEMGLHMISLGSWNSDLIRKEVDPKSIFKLDNVDFPFEGRDYRSVPRQKTPNGKLRVATYIKFEEKRAPYLIFKQLEVALAALGSDKLEIHFFGFDSHIEVPFGVNHGMLGLSELNTLYSQCDLGLVASLTNISLVNYEMIACGLAVIDYREGSVLSFLAEDEILVADFRPDALLTLFQRCLSGEVDLSQIQKKALARIRTLSWEGTARQFDQILQGLRTS